MIAICDFVSPRHSWIFDFSFCKQKIRADDYKAVRFQVNGIVSELAANSNE
jgi:hypothetical protein